MTHVYRVQGWSVTFPIVSSRRRFAGYADGIVGRAFFRTRKEARAYLKASTHRRRWRGRVVQAELVLRVNDVLRSASAVEGV